MIFTIAARNMLSKKLRHIPTFPSPNFYLPPVNGLADLMHGHVMNIFVSLIWGLVRLKFIFWSFPCRMANQCKNEKRLKNLVFSVFPKIAIFVHLLQNLCTKLENILGLCAPLWYLVTQEKSTLYLKIHFFQNLFSSRKGPCQLHPCLQPYWL